MRSCYTMTYCPFGPHPFFVIKKFGKPKPINKMYIKHFNMSICSKKETLHPMFNF